MRLKKNVLLSAAVAILGLTGATLHAQKADTPTTLEDQFRNPPMSARPRIWWHWINGNIRQEDLLADLAWMKRVGLGGAQAFDAYVPAPQIVDRRVSYMSPEWQTSFRAVAARADALGLELGIPTSPGWSATGSPWVIPRDAMKKLVWSETPAIGGRRFRGTLPQPSSVSGPFQSLRRSVDIADLMWGKNPPKWPMLPEQYADVAVLAVPGGGLPVTPAEARSGVGTALSLTALSGIDLENGVTIPRGTAKLPSSIVLRFKRATTICSATAFVAGAKSIALGAAIMPVVEASDDGTSWRQIAVLPATEVPTTAGFPAVTAKFFRLVLKPAAPRMLDLGAPAPGVATPDATEFVKMMTAPWKVSQFTLSSDVSIDRFEAKAGYAVLDDYYGVPQPKDGAIGPDPRSVIDLTGKMRADGTLDWIAPPGRWRIIRLGYSLVGSVNHPANPEATGLEVDKYDAAAVRRYLETYLATYRNAVGPDLIGAHGIRALVSDSIEAGASNWTPSMVAQFKRLRGYDPTRWLPTLAGVLVGDRAQSDKFLFDYRQTLAELISSEHYGTLADVARENGLKIYGEALESNRFLLGDDMAMRSHTTVPMAAMWTFGRAQKPNASLVADLRGAASVAHIYGQNVVAAESMTSMLNYWNDSPASLKRIIDLEFVNGVNLPVIHTSVHSPSDTKLPGLSLSYFGQFFNRHETWADLGRPWVDYIARNSLLLQKGVNVADVAYFYGEEAPLIAVFAKAPPSDAPRTHAFDFVNSDALLTQLENDGDQIVTPGGARYRALYLGGSTEHMSLAILRRIAKLVEGGATVIGTAPRADPALRDDPMEFAALVGKLWPSGEQAHFGRGRVIASHDIDVALAGIGVAPQFRIDSAPDADIPFVQRRLADGDSFFLVNRRDRPEQITAHFRVTAKVPELWHADTGRVEPVSYTIANGETTVPLTLAAEESVHIVFRRAASVNAAVIDAPRLTRASRLMGPWTVDFQPGRAAPPHISLAELSPLNEAKDPGVRYFSGIAAYRHTFSAPKIWRSGRSLWLDLGKVGDLAEVRVNGRSAGTVWHSPFRLDIGALARKGTNTLEVHVANLWVNRLIGDMQPGAMKTTFTALPTYQAGAPLRPSGLIGPVEVLVYQSR